MSDAFWKGLFDNAPAIIGAIFAGIAMVTSLFNGRKANNAVVKMEAVRQEVTATKAVAQEAVDKTVKLEEGHEYLKQSMETNTRSADEIKAMIQQHQSDFGKLS